MLDSLLAVQTSIQLIKFASMCVNLPGEVAELGVYKGGSLDLLSRIFLHKILYGFDTFEGMPEVDSNIDVHQAGDFSDTSFEKLSDYFAGTNVKLIKGRFPDTVSQVPELQYCFVHIDGDIYQSTRDAIAYFYPRLVTGGMLVFDDWGWVGCPGVGQAVEEYFPGRELLAVGNEAMIQKI
jgi:hypothetical protein